MRYRLSLVLFGAVTLRVLSCCHSQSVLPSPSRGSYNVSLFIYSSLYKQQDVSKFIRDVFLKFYGLIAFVKGMLSMLLSDHILLPFSRI